MKTLNRIDLIAQSILIPGTIIYALSHDNQDFWYFLTPYFTVGAWQFLIAICYIASPQALSKERKRYIKNMSITLGIMALTSPLFIITGWLALAYTPFLAFWNYSIAWKARKSLNESYNAYNLNHAKAS